MKRSVSQKADFTCPLCNDKNNRFHIFDYTELHSIEYRCVVCNEYSKYVNTDSDLSAYKEEVYIVINNRTYIIQIDNEMNDTTSLFEYSSDEDLFIYFLKFKKIFFSSKEDLVNKIKTYITFS